MAALEWESIRRRSPSVREFATNLRAEVERLPKEKRAAAYRDTLRTISPLLETRVAEEAQLWVDRGYPADRSLRAATYASLIGRRRALFHDLFARFIPEEVDKVMKTMDGNLSMDAKRTALDTIFAQLRPEPLMSHPKPNGEARLRETGFPEPFIQWALTRKPLDADDIRAEITANMDAGMDGREALRRGLELAASEYALDYMMASGVAIGPDFCGIAAIVTTAIGLALSIAGTVTNAVRQSRAAQEQRAAQSAAEAGYYTNPLSDDEIGVQVGIYRSEGLTKSRALQSLLDYMRSVRQGRTRLFYAETQAFERNWSRAEEADRALKAQAAQQADLPRKLVAYGAPLLGALVLGYALIR